MSFKARKESIVGKAEHDFGMSFVKLMETCKNDKIPIVEVAEMLGCTLSNLHRILRENKFCYFKSQKDLMLSDVEEFTADCINPTNIFSRSWNNKQQCIKGSQ